MHLPPFTKDIMIIANLKPVETIIGDHKLLTMTIDEIKQTPITSYRRDWHKYTKELLCNELKKMSFNEGIDDVQNYWNSIE